MHASLISRPGTKDHDWTPSNIGASASEPLYNNWTRPVQTAGWGKAMDAFYLCREDGVLLYYTIEEFAGKISLTRPMRIELPCRIGSGFSMLNDAHGVSPVFICAPSVDNGFVFEVTEGLSTIRTLDTIQNWASISGSCIANRSRAGFKSHTEAGNLVIASGQEPYGSISELQRGMRCRMERVRTPILEEITLLGMNGLWLFDFEGISPNALLSFPDRSIWCKLPEWDCTPVIDWSLLHTSGCELPTTTLAAASCRIPLYNSDIVIISDTSINLIGRGDQMTPEVVKSHSIPKSYVAAIDTVS